jgi:hypothetical protein
MFDEPMDINVLNANLDLDFFTAYNRDYKDNEVNDNPYFGITVSSKFYDLNCLSSTAFASKSPLLLSINIQSLQSKHEQLCTEIADLEN